MFGRLQKVNTKIVKRKIYNIAFNFFLVKSLFFGYCFNNRAEYSIGTDAYRDPDCLECKVLPICGGDAPTSGCGQNSSVKRVWNSAHPTRITLLPISKPTLIRYS